MNKDRIENKMSATGYSASGKLNETHISLFISGIVFFVTYSYLYYFSDYLFFYQENFSLFVFSGQYLQPFLHKPGGILEYAGDFLAQGYFNPFYGPFIVSLVLAVFSFVILRISKRMSPAGPASWFFPVLVISLLILMQTSFNWFLRSNLGFLFTSLYFLISIGSESKRKRTLILVLFPLFYYLTGVFAAIYLGMYIVYHIIFVKGIARYIYPASLLIIAFLSFILYREFIFYQSTPELLISPFSAREHFMHPLILYILIGVLIIFPLLVKLSSYLNTRFKLPGFIPMLTVTPVFILCVFFMARWYNPKIANLFHLEKLVFQQDWDAVIEHQETVRLSNIVAQFYYNLALSEKGILCDRLFFGRQDFGPMALIIPWDTKAGVNNISRGVYFFYTVGLINEAHRWAYESMVAQGYNPENIKLLIKTDLINGHYEMAQKYISILKKTLHYRKLAVKYENMIKNPELILSDPELGSKIKLLPKENFSISIKNPQTNLPLLLDANPGNKIAFEYLMSWYLLEKNIEGFLTDVGRIKQCSYKRIPRHIEEALLIKDPGLGAGPDLGNLSISQETIIRYQDYRKFSDPFFGIQTHDQRDPKNLNRNTFWYYFDYR